MVTIRIEFRVSGVSAVGAAAGGEILHCTVGLHRTEKDLHVGGAHLHLKKYKHSADLIINTLFYMQLSANIQH